MREAKFILPLIAGQGAGHEYARQALLNSFGGYTFHKVEGAWQSSSDGGVEIDESIQYVVALDHGWASFRAIALQAGRLEQQKAVYVVSPTGEAEIVHLPHHAGKAGKADRIVRPDPEAALTPHQQSIMHRPDKNNGENLPVQEGDLWLTADESLVRITNRKMSGQAYATIIKSDNEFSTGSSLVYHAHNGRYEMMVDGPHPMHLKKLLHRR